MKDRKSAPKSLPEFAEGLGTLLQHLVMQD